MLLSTFCRGFDSLKPSARFGLPFFRLLVSGPIDNHHKILLAIAIALNSPLELEGETPSLKTTHTGTIGYRETKLELI